MKNKQAVNAAPIIIYQMGKVGSKTIFHSLKETGVPNPVFHLHFLSEKGIHGAEDYYKAFTGSGLPSHLQTSKFVKDLLKKSRGALRWKIITMVRDPIARQVSDLFENLDFIMPDVSSQSEASAKQRICDYLHERFGKFDESEDYVCTWFDRELKTTFGIDIFQHKFNPTKGYEIYRTGTADILLIRLEELNRVAGEAIKEFLGIASFSLVPSNRAVDKDIYPLYRKVLDCFRLPNEILDRVYGSRFAKHFYSPEEISAFRQRWGLQKPKDVETATEHRLASLRRKRIMVIHPEGNINDNANLAGILETLCQKGYAVDYYGLKRNVPQGAQIPGVRMFLKDQRGRKPLDGLVCIDADGSPSILKTVEITAGSLPVYDLIIGVDRGIIEAGLLARSRNVPYGLISYEIFFQSETGMEFKREEIEACKGLAFAVCQDKVRAGHLARENRIDFEKIITIPMGGRGIFEPGKTDYLHRKLRIPYDKQIALMIGSLSKWTMINYILASQRSWPDEWVLVLHGRYGLQSDEKGIFRQSRQMPHVFFSLQPADSPQALKQIVQSADVGLAFYRPTNDSLYTGDNIRHIGMASGKIATYLQSGLPVIVNEIGEMSEHVRRYKLGRVVDTSALFSPAIESGELTAMRRNCHQFFRNRLNLDHTIQTLLGRIETLIGSDLMKGTSTVVAPPAATASAKAELRLESTAVASSQDLPKISVVTPSMNQALYLEKCILSVLNQNYPNLEYIIMDGGSSDGSKEIIKKYASRLKYWRSGSDKGHYWAIQEGFERCTGDIMTWLNADDLFDPYAFRVVASIFQQRSEIDWLTGRQTRIEGAGEYLSINNRLPLWSRKKYLEKRYHHPFIQQEGTFWRRSLWQRSGGRLDTQLALAGDLELWARFFRYARLHSVDYGLAFYRVHGENRAIRYMDRYMQEAEKIIEREINIFSEEKNSTPAGPPLPVTKKQIAEYLSAAQSISEGTSCSLPGQSSGAACNMQDRPDAQEANAEQSRPSKVMSRLVQIPKEIIDQFFEEFPGRSASTNGCAVTFILPTKDRAEGLRDVLACLADAMRDLIYEIILYADKPGENIAACIKKYNIEKVFYDSDVFGRGEPFAWPRLMNHGFSHASGKWIMFGSDDIFLYPNSFVNALSLAERKGDKPVGGVSFLHRNTAETYDGFFTDFGYDTLNGDKPFINFGLINAEAYKSTEGFDEKLKFFWADVDICAQMLERGYAIVPSIGSFVDHRNVLEKEDKIQRISLFEQDTAYFFGKWNSSGLFGGKSPLEKVRYFVSANESPRIIASLTRRSRKAVDAEVLRRPKVVIDGVIFQLQSNKAQGISRVWKNLIDELAHRLPEAQITVLQRKGFDVPVNEIETCVIPAFNLAHTDQFDADDEMLSRVCRDLKADVFISTYFTRAPGVVNVVMVHDLIPEKLGFDLTQPEWVAKQRVIETADAFMCVSETTRNDLKAFYPHVANRPMLVAYNGLDDCFEVPSEEDVQHLRARLKLIGPYVMLVGNRHGYKNGIGLLNALAGMRNDAMPTVLCVGGEHPESPAETRLKDKLDIRYVRHLNDRELATAYGGALALLVPSRYEGFGLPVIEAMACGCPVIAYASSAVREIGADAVCYADLGSSDDIRRALHEITQTPQRTAYIHKGRKRASTFSWQSTSALIKGFIADLANKPSILLTAIVSTFNAAEYIGGCLEDLENQTVAGRLEIIVVDSASEQDEAATIRDFQSRYSNIKYIRTPVRESVYRAWNRGIKFALGKYITNANTDDRHRRDAFEQMTGVLEENEKVALVYADVIKTGTANETFYECTPTGMFRWYDWNRQTLLAKGCFMGPQPVWRRSVHATCGYFNEKYVVSSDFEFWLRISQIYDFYHIDKPLGLYLERMDSVEHAHADIKRNEDLEIITMYRDAAAKGRLIGLNPSGREQTVNNSIGQPPCNRQDTADAIGETVFPAHGSQQGGNIMTSGDTVLKGIQYLIAGGHKEAAYWTLKKLVGDLPDHAGLHDQAAAMAYEAGKMEEALRHFELAARLSPENAAYQKNLGDFYYVVQKDAQRALVQYEKVLAIEPQNIEALMIAGHVAISLHRYQEAQTYYERTLSLDPGNAEIRRIINKMTDYPRGGQPDNQLTVDEIHASAVEKAGAGDRQGAIKLLEELLGRECDQALIHNDLGVLYYECGSKAEAQNHYENAAMLQPENEVYLKNLADFYWSELGDHQRAMEVYVQVLKLDPRDVEALLNCGQICLTLGKKNDAREFLETILEIEPWNQDANEILDRMATSAVRDGELSANPAENPERESIEDLKRKLGQSPQNAELHNDLGVLYYEAGEKDQAQASYERAVELNPHEPNYLKNLADFYLMERGRFEEAMKLYLQVLSQNAEDVEALNATGMICASLGKTKDARYFYERALEIQPWDEYASNALNNLQDDNEACPEGNSICAAG